jgi:hypothetical protein
MPHTRHPGNLPLQLLTDPMEVLTGWVVSVDDNLVTLSTTPLITTATALAENAMFQRQLFVIPVAASSSVHEALNGEVQWGSAVAPNPGGHVVAVLGRAIRNNSGGGVSNVLLLIGTEGVVQNIGAGIVTEAAPLVAHMNLNSGTITALRNVVSVVSNNTGVITELTHFDIDACAEIGTNPVTEWSLRSQRVNARMRHRGPVLGAFGTLRAADGGGGELGPGANTGHVAGVRYSTPLRLAASPSALGANLVYGAPVYVSERCTLATLGLTVTTAGSAGQVARLAMWPLVRGTVRAKVAECAEFTVDATGTRSGAVAGSIVIEAGWYLLGAVTNSATVQVRIRTDQSLAGILGTTNVDGDDTLLLLAQTYGVLPSTPTFTRTANTSSIVPELFFTVA